MTVGKKAYCGEENGRWYLSKFPKDVQGRPKNLYESKEDAIRHAAGRGLEIIYE